MKELTLLKLFSLACLCLYLAACGGGGDTPAEQINRWDDASGAADILIWDDGSSSNNMKWAD